MFETGAKTALANDLILFADNTSVLHEHKMAIYAKHKDVPNDQAIEKLTKAFKPFTEKIIQQYKNEMGNECFADTVKGSEEYQRSYGLNTNNHLQEAKDEVCTLYAKEFFSFDVQQHIKDGMPQMEMAETDYSGILERTIGKAQGKNMMVSRPILEIIGNAYTEGLSLYINCGQIDKKSYQQVNEVLELMGGKWHSKSRSHRFKTDPAPLLDSLLTTGQIGVPEDYNFFPTPAELAGKVIEMAHIKEGMKVLEPSAGDAHLAERAAAIAGRANTHCMEIQDDKRQALQDKGFPVVGSDFLQMQPVPTYDRIVMNPPFSRQQDIRHVTHAMGFLKPKGILVAIMSAGVTFRNDKAATAFRQLLSENDGQIMENPAGSFKSSGTGVGTITVTMRQNSEAAMHYAVAEQTPLPDMHKEHGAESNYPRNNIHAVEEQLVLIP